MSSVAADLPRGWEAIPRGSTQHAALALTWVRVPIGLVVAWTMVGQHRPLGLCVLSLFVAVDWLDGAVARRWGGDTAERRALDSAVDRLITPVAMLGAGMTVPPLAVLAVLLLGTSSIAAPAARRNLRDAGLVLRAPAWHKSWSLSLALGGVLFLMGLDQAAVFAATIGVLLASVCTAQLRSIHLELHSRRD